MSNMALIQLFPTESDVPRIPRNHGGDAGICRRTASEPAKPLEPESIPVQVPASVVETLRRTAQEHQTALMTVILAMYAAAAATAVDQEHVLINMVTSGRDHPLSDVVSCFVQLLPVIIHHAHAPKKNILTDQSNVLDRSRARSPTRTAQSSTQQAQFAMKRAQSSTGSTQSSLSYLISHTSAQMGESMRHDIPIGNILEAAGDLGSAMPFFCLNADFDMTRSAGILDIHGIAASRLDLRGIAPPFGVAMLTGGRKAVLFLRADREGGLKGNFGFDPAFLRPSEAQRLMDTFQVRCSPPCSPAAS